MAKSVKETICNELGIATGYILEGNTTPTPKKTAFRMAKNGQITGVVGVINKKGENFLRSLPDGNKRNNLKP